MGENHDWETLPDMYHADKIAIGQIYLDLYQQKAEEVMIKNIKWILDANLLRNKPMPDVDTKTTHIDTSGGVGVMHCL